MITTLASKEAILVSAVIIQDAIIFLEDSKNAPKDVAMTQKCLSEVGQI